MWGWAGAGGDNVAGAKPRPTGQDAALRGGRKANRQARVVPCLPVVVRWGIVAGAYFKVKGRRWTWRLSVPIMASKSPGS